MFTGRGRAATQLILETLHFAGRFVGVFAGDDGPPKPAPDGVRLLAQTMGCAPRDVVVVGDSPLDMEAAAAAGAAPRLAVWFARGVTRSSHPAVRLQHPDELHALLDLPEPTA